MAMISIQSTEQKKKLIEIINSFYMFLLLQSPEVLLFKNHVGMCRPKGVCFFAPFWCGIGYGNNRVA